MDSETEKAPAKKTARFKQNIQTNECVRPFKLRRHFPSTITELKKNGIEKGPNTTQANAVTNIISALPLSNNMKFIPNKEVPPSEVQNLQKLKLKTASGVDLGEYNVSMASKLQGKVITVPKIIEKSGKLKKWTESVPEEIQGQKPKIKNITQLLSSSPNEEQCKNSGEARFSKTTVQIVNGEKSLSLNTTQSCSKPIIIKTTSGDVLKKIVRPNIVFSTQPKQPQLVTMKKIAGFPKVVMVQKGNNQLVTATPDKIEQFNLVRKSLPNNQAIKKDDEKVGIQMQLGNSSLKKRDSSSLDQPKTFENKRLRQDTVNDNMEESQERSKEASGTILDEPPEIQSFSDQTVSAVSPKKDIMVIVPSDAAKELTMAHNSLNMDDDFMNEMIILNDDETIESNNYNQDTELLNKSKAISSPNQEEAESRTDENTHNSNSENLLDEFSILEKAVLSVKDDNLRAKALKALKDCGIKAKKKVVVRRPLPTKIINESSVQTNVFSLLKEGEFLEADEVNENLTKIKSSRKSSTKHSMTTTDNMYKNKNVHDPVEYRMQLDSMVDKFMDKGNKDVANVRSAFEQNSKLQAESIFKKLLRDFEAAKNYDSDGYLGIHKAVANNNLQEVQKHIIILKAAKRNIDVCTEDGQTSLELAVELEVDPQITKILLDSGAQPVSSKAVHDSAVILAAKKSSRILPLLLKYVNRNQKKLVNAKNSEGFAAIHYCAQYGYLEGVTELIRAGADVNIQDERSGRTALFYAVDTKNNDVPQEVYNEIAQKLVDNGAFSNIPTYSKHSVLSLIDDVKSHTLKIALNRAVR